MAKSRKSHANRIAPHGKGRKKGKCPHCGAWHDRSAHWSHVHGTHTGAHGESSWYGRKARPQGKRKRLPKRSAAEMLRMGKRRPARAKTTRARALAERRRIQTGHHETIKMLERHAGGGEHVVAGHLAKNPKKRGKHRVKAHLAENPGKKHKRKMSAKQRAAMMKNLAKARAARRKG